MKQGGAWFFTARYGVLVCGYQYTVRVLGVQDTNGGMETVLENSYLPNYV
jgi:hypothetical protein